ncbi:MAG: CocE/NonD family hydrolase [Promethearchaeota archaeon]|jgi:predicted acyl esterase
MIFFQLYSLGYLNVEQIITTNLITILICRGLYIVAYYFNYYKDHNKELKEGQKLFTKNEIVTFTLKQVSITMFGMMYFPIAVFISFYSLLMTTNYLKQISIKLRIKYIDIIAKLFNILIPLGGIIWFLLIEVNYYSIAAVGISLIVYFHYGMKNSNLSLSKLIHKYDRRLLNNLPRFVKPVCMFLLIAIPSTILTISLVYAPAEKVTYKIEMRDGTRLATDVYIAPGSFETPKPVILIRTPYGKNGMGTYRTFYSTQDYHLVIQDLRGTHDSDGAGEFILFIKDYHDGVDTINWILDQTWCNGKIASAGPSALCINQYFYAGMAPEGLVAQQLWFGTPELYDHAIYQGSYHKSSVETWIQSTAPDNWESQIDTLFTYSSPKNETLYNSTSLSIPIGPTYSNINMNFSYLYDPRNPVPNLGGQNQPFDLAGPMDQRSIESRSDVIIFETSALNESVETVGRIWGQLFVSSNCTDTDFTVKLTDVYPDGRSMLITDGSLTVRSRNNYTSDAFMSGNSNDVYELFVDLWSSAYVFAPNHKIRIAISSSNYPRFAANPNTGAKLASSYLNYNIANNTLLIGPDYPSCIILPRLVNMSSTHTSY